MTFVYLTGIDDTPLYINPTKIIGVAPYDFEGVEREVEEMIFDEEIASYLTVRKKVKDKIHGSKVYVDGDVFNVKDDFKVVRDKIGGV